MSFERVLVVGAGQMGSGIAQVVAGSGRQVLLHDAAPGATERGLQAMRKSLERLAAKDGGLDPDEILARVEPVDDLVEAELMIEAVVEELAVKEDIFRRADEALPASAVLASNTSAIPIHAIAEATEDRVAPVKAPCAEAVATRWWRSSWSWRFSRPCRWLRFRGFSSCRSATP